MESKIYRLSLFFNPFFNAFPKFSPVLISKVDDIIHLFLFFLYMGVLIPDA